MTRFQGLLLIVLAFCFSTAQGAQTVVGVWTGDVFIDNPDFKTGFPTLLAFHQGGTMGEVHLPHTPENGSPFGSFSGTPAFGIWESSGEGQWKASFKFFLQGGPQNEKHANAMIGTNNVHYTIELGEDGNSMNATWSSELIDAEGKTILAGTGRFVGTRMQVQK